jgi:hypothetical protein
MTSLLAVTAMINGHGVARRVARTSCDVTDSSHVSILIEKEFRVGTVVYFKFKLLREVHLLGGSLYRYIPTYSTYLPSYIVCVGLSFMPKDPQRTNENRHVGFRVLRYPCLSLPPHNFSAEHGITPSVYCG